MQNKKKWLAIGGGALVVVALGSAVVLNQGGLFTGNLTRINTLTGTKTVAGADAAMYAEEAKNLNLTPDSPIYDYQDSVTKVNYTVSVATSVSSAFEKDAGGTLTMDVAKYKSLNGSNDVYFKLVAAPSELKMVAPEIKVGEFQAGDKLGEAIIIEKDNNTNIAPSEVIMSPIIKGNTITTPVFVEPVTGGDSAGLDREAVFVQSAEGTTVSEEEMIRAREQAAREARARQAAGLPTAHAQDASATNVINSYLSPNADLVMKIRDASTYPTEKYDINIIRNDSALTRFPLVIKNTTCEDIAGFAFDPESVTYNPQNTEKLFKVLLKAVSKSGALIDAEKACQGSIVKLAGGENMVLKLNDAQKDVSDMEKLSFMEKSKGEKLMFNGFMSLGTSSITYNFENLSVGTNLGQLSYDKTYDFSLMTADGSKAISKVLPLTLMAEAVKPVETTPAETVKPSLDAEQNPAIITRTPTVRDPNVLIPVVVERTPSETPKLSETDITPKIEVPTVKTPSETPKLSETDNTPKIEVPTKPAATEQAQPKPTLPSTPAAAEQAQPKPTLPSTPVIVTQPSSTPCVVNGQTFYLAGGPGSDYCKNLQNAAFNNVATPTAPAQSVFQSDLPLETPQVRYTTALAVGRGVNAIKALKIRNLSTDWANAYTDAKQISSVSTQEKTDFRTVVAQKVLTGRINPQNQSLVTLAPLDQVTHAELLSMMRQALDSATNTTSVVIDANLPAFLLKLYKENPKDYTWAALAVSEGVRYGYYSKNEISQDTLFTGLANRGDMARYLAKLATNLNANPALLRSAN